MILKRIAQNLSAEIANGTISSSYILRCIVYVQVCETHSLQNLIFNKNTINGTILSTTFNTNEKLLFGYDSLFGCNMVNTVLLFFRNQSKVEIRLCLNT